MKFDAAFLRDVVDGAAQLAEVVETRITGTARWSIQHEMVFSFNGKFYRSQYRTAATEQQDEQPYEYEDTVDCPEVVPVEVTKIEYVKA